MNQETKNCIDCKNEFEIDSGDLVLYEKIGLKIPEQCFFCRIKQYSAFWVFGKFRKGVSNLSGESLITVLPSSPRYPIYTSHEWWGDAWDPMTFGQDYNSSRPFFDQLKELQEKIPRPHQVSSKSTNCDWCDDSWDSKNCYLCRSILKFSENSKDCIDSYFLFDCRNCQNCFMCWNLRNKQYCIRNKQYTKEAYEQELKNIKLDSYENVENLKNELENMLKNEAVHRENFNLKTTNSIGNYMTNCDKCVNVFSWENSQNSRNSLRGLNTKDCIDQLGCWNNEISGDNSCVTGGYEIKHSSWSDCRYSEYIDLCIEVEHCFGCVGLRKKKYCILNKQYEKEEYEILKDKIIKDMEKRGEYGKYLPYSMGICDYNLSNGFVYFPQTTKEEIIKKGGYWSEENLSSKDGISSAKLPDSILDTKPEITSQALICPETHYRFNISQDEYEFHKSKNFALPRIHFDLRILKKVKKITALRGYPYQCIYCSKNINAYYPPEWGYQKIACEDCYKKNIA